MPRTLDDLWEPRPPYQTCPICRHTIATLRDHNHHMRECIEPYLAEERAKADESMNDEADRWLAQQRQERIEEALR
jgi:hypothetical protein